jgi:hypothetical protein
MQQSLHDPVDDVLLDADFEWKEALECALAELHSLHVVHTCRSASLYADEQIWARIPAAYRVLETETASIALQTEGAALAETLLRPFQQPPEQFCRARRSPPPDTRFEQVYRYLPARKAIQVRELACRLHALLEKIIGDGKDECLHLLEPGCGRGLVSQTIWATLQESGFGARIELIGIDKDEELCQSFRERWQRLEPLAKDIHCSIHHSFIERAADIERCARSKAEPSQSGQDPWVVLALHGCGDLSVRVLETLDDKLCSLQPSAVFCVGCCYHKRWRQDDLDEHVRRPAHKTTFPLSQRLQHQPGFSYGEQAYGGETLWNRSSLYLASADATALQRPGSQRARRIIQHHHYRAMLEVLLRRMAENNDSGATEARELLESARDPRWALLRRKSKRIDQYPNFTAYAADALRCLELPYESMLVDKVATAYDTADYRRRCFVFWSLCGRLSPILEAIVLLDRVWYARERDYLSWIEELFPVDASPRNRAIIAIRKDIADRVRCGAADDEHEVSP